MMGIANMGGKYEGKGSWHDSAGNSGSYDVVQSNCVTKDGFRIRQTHVHDGVGADMDITLEKVAPYVYSVEATGTEGGHGYIVDDVVRLYVDNHLGSVTEIGYQPGEAGKLRVHGSCTKNSDGNYIMWREELHRVPDTK